jgi:hypothetical protein
MNTLKLALNTIMASGFIIAGSINAAQASTWSIVGAGCVPTGQTTTGLLAFNSAGDASFASTKTGEIILTCPVPSYINSLTTISMLYRDSDGAGALVNVQANLRKKDLRTGAASDFLLAKLSSSVGPLSGVASYAVASDTVTSPSSLCPGGGTVRPQPLDHTKFAYYVQINIKRSTVTQGAIFGRVTLDDTLIC